MEHEFMKINNYNNQKNVSGLKIKELRLKKNMSQQQLAEKMQLIRNFFNSKRNFKNRIRKQINSRF